MAIVYQGSGKILIGASNISLNCSAISLEVGQDALEATAMGATGHKMVGGLQTVSVSASVYLEYGATAVEKTIFDTIGKGDTTIIISPTSAAVGVANPTYTITNAMISSAMTVNSQTGVLDTMTLTASNGTFARATV